REDFAAAEEDLNRGVRSGRQSPGRALSSEFLVPWVARARLRMERGVFLAESGADPGADWSAAEQDLELAIGFNKKDAEAWAESGRLRLLRSRWRESKGEKEAAAALAREASQSFSQALAINPLLESRLARDREEARRRDGSR